MPFETNAAGELIVPLGERFCRIPQDPGNPKGHLCYNDQCFSGPQNLRKHMEKVHPGVTIEKAHRGASTTIEMIAAKAYYQALVPQLKGMDKDKAPPATPSKASK